MPERNEYPRGPVKFDSIHAHRAAMHELWVPNDAGTMTKVLQTATDLNNLALTTRKYTVYSVGALAVGDLLHISSYEAVNDVFVVEKADADTTGKQAQLIATEVNAGTATSEAADLEELTGLNTNGGSVGDPVYLSAATAGSWTLTAPTGADQIVQIVGRIKVKSATVGIIAFNTVKADLVKIGTSGLQDSSVTSDKIAPNTIVLADLGPDIARKFTVYSVGALAVGELLHISSYDFTNDVFIVEKADADTSGKPAQLVASAVNAGNTTSEARDILELTTLNTDAGSVGDPVYLDGTAAGNWTLTGPTGADQLKQIVGRIKVKSATVGKIVFNVVKAELVSVGTSALQPLGVTIPKLEVALLKGVSTFTMSFETAEQTTTRIYFPAKVTINKIRGIVMKAIAASDNGTVTCGNSTGASASGVLTAVASDALNVEYSASPTTNNVVLADGYYYLTSAKSTAGGKVLVSLEWTRTA
jgi:hypothetical protein